MHQKYAPVTPPVREPGSCWQPHTPLVTGQQRVGSGAISTA
jgi:hypothetical protein